MSEWKAKIEEGIRKQSYADEGEIIAALVDGDSATLKTYYRDDENKKIVLRA